MKVLVVFGTRPEAIKMCPLVLELEDAPEVECIVCTTGQHRQMLDQVLEIFHVMPEHDLNIMKPGQTLTTITASVLKSIEKVFATVQPDVVLVHGDTTTSMSAALAAFYQKIPVGHVEAGLRTYDRYSPFPEEMNRKIISALSTYHFAPTVKNEEALLREGVREGVFVTGNTVIDSFKYTVSADHVYKNPLLQAYDFSKPTVLLTAHRRENLGEPLENICRAVNQLTEQFPDLHVIYPMHLNPLVQNTARAALGDNERCLLIDPIDVCDMHNAMNESVLVMTDSGGLQEEAPHLGKPVVVLRTETERPEAVEAGTAVVAGVDTESITSTVSSILSDESRYRAMSTAINPYGDGHASERICSILKEQLCNKAQ